MSTNTRTQRRYDHRLRELVRSTRKIDIALESGVPRSTAYGWLAHSHDDVVTLDVLESDVAELQRETYRGKPKSRTPLRLTDQIPVENRKSPVVALRSRLAKWRCWLTESGRNWGVQPRPVS